MNEVHTPVFETEVLSQLHVHTGGRYIDATANGGGHTRAILRAGGKLLAIEWDRGLAEALRTKLEKEFPGGKWVVRHANYADLEKIAAEENFRNVDGIFFDLGVSSYHLDRSGRGFSFQKKEPLDMRFDRSIGPSAAEWLAKISEPEFERILREYGNERYAKAIARQVVGSRKAQPISMTTDLVAAIARALPKRAKRGRVHFATRTFQAIRIAVNHEFEHIEQGLAAAANVVKIGGRIAVISFHSGEDRIVKKFFSRELKKTQFQQITKKPLSPDRREVLGNPRARSAKLRVYEKIL